MLGVRSFYTFILLKVVSCQVAELSDGGPELLVIDTDGGGDDVGAIFLALNDAKAAHVLAITCTFGNTDLDNACTNVLRILTVCRESQIPVHRGSYGPLLKQDHLPSVYGKDGFGNVAHEFPTGGLKESNVSAPLALIDLAKQYPKKINLVAIGPLTNVALAHRMDPNFTKNLKSIVMMGGNYKGIGNIHGVAEYNFYCDPESAHIVLTEAECPVVRIPWEPVLEFGIKWPVYDRMADVPTRKANFLKRISQFFVDSSRRDGIDKYYDADFFAVATLLYPQCVTASIQRPTVVECQGTYARGETIIFNNASDAPVQNKIQTTTSYDEDILNKLRFQMLED